jgi:transcriptional regulator with XRE-family HTH domain
MTILKDTMQRRGITQGQLVYMARIPQSQLSMIASGKLFPCPAWRTRISEALGVAEETFFSEKDFEVKRSPVDRANPARET